MPKYFYSYRALTQADRQVCFRIIPLYSLLAAGCIFPLIGAEGRWQTIWGSLLAHSLLMVIDAISVLIWKRVQPFGQRFWHYLIASQNPDPFNFSIFDFFALVVFLAGIASNWPNKP